MQSSSPDPWLSLVISLPTGRRAARMRVWRGLKALGAGVLRDGVYLLPAEDRHRDVLASWAGEVRRAGGSAELLSVTTPEPGAAQRLRDLFDRNGRYMALDRALAGMARRLPRLREAGARRELKQRRREFEDLVAIDYFPGQAQAALRLRLAELGAAVEARYSPGEPAAVETGIRMLDRHDYQGRLWATRAGLWVDRIACAWLIARFIDDQARFAWLKRPADCPRDALGFDFDGAAFTHVGRYVSFEVLLRSFGLDSDAALRRVAALVHHLDVGGAPVSEAAGVEAVLSGARRRCADDDALLAEAGGVFDSLYAAYAATANGES